MNDPIGVMHSGEHKLANPRKMPMWEAIKKCQHPNGVDYMVYFKEHREPVMVSLSRYDLRYLGRSGAEGSHLLHQAIEKAWRAKHGL